MPSSFISGGGGEQITKNGRKQIFNLKKNEFEISWIQRNNNYYLK